LRLVMRNVLPVALIMGVIAGLVVAGYFNVFNVPVMEWAISLEEAAAEAEAAATGDATEDEGGIAVSLGMQRIGMSAGLVVVGVLFGAIFTGLYHLVRRAAPGWNMWAWASIAGLLGFWAVSLFSQIRYPLNPPGIGDEGSLLARQGFQFLFILISLAAAVGLCLAAKVINESGTSGVQRFIRYAGVAVVYAVVALIISYAIPGNPDSIPEWVPDALIIMFRSFTIIGHFLLWMGISLGVVGYMRYKERAIEAHPNSSEGVAEPANRGTSVG
jgi:predicted cobalt transporter CbtA